MTSTSHGQLVSGGSKSFIAGLTGLRGWGAVVVFVHHMFVYLPEQRSTIDEAAAVLAIPLYLIIDCFLLMSGMFICRILLNDGTDREALKNYTVRRILRIVPLYWLVVVALTFVLPVVIDQIGAPTTWAELGDGLRDLAAPHLLLVHNVLLDAGSTSAEFSLSHLWTVGLELHFYLLAPLLVIVARRRVTETATALALAVMVVRVLAAAGGASADTVYRQLWFHCDGLLLGMAMAAAQMEGKKVLWDRVPRKVIASSIPLLFLMGLALITRYPDAGYERPFTLTSSTIFAVLVVENTLKGPDTFWSRLLNKPHWLWLGDRSYPFYLLHVPILVVVTLLVDDALVIGSGSSPVRLLNSIAVGLVSFAITLGLSHLLHQVVERPLLAYAGRFRKDVPTPAAD